MRQAFPSEQSHERVGERLHTLIERFQGRFATDRIPQQHRHKVDKIIVPEAAACKAHLLLYCYKHALAFQEVRNQALLPKPAGR
jgi:hypothetical protein